jgi:ketosteroid isomerase-like protein
MQNRVLMTLLLNVMAFLAFSMPVFADDQSTPSLTELAEQVRATEIAFSKTLADRDVKAFTSMIAPDVIWIADRPLHGPAEVVVSWKPFFEGPKAPFSWAPEIVEVQEGGKLALSRGPVLNPEGKRVGTYTSIWRREKSGKWLIIFDSGCPGCDCAAEKK